jgi:hypothetical protein
MRGRADAANAAGDLGHVLRRPAQAEHLEAAQLRHLHVGAFDVALVIKVDIDLAMTLEAGDGIDGDIALAVLIRRVRPRAALVEQIFGCWFHNSNPQWPLPEVGRLTLRRRRLFASPYR